MSKTWQRLNSLEEFEAYKARITRENRLQAARIDWSAAPQQFPCLVASTLCLFPQTGKVILAFVYVDDAKELLQASTSLPSSVASKPDEIAKPNQAHYNRWNTALQATVIHFMVQTGICKESQFEAELLNKLELVDKFTDEQFAAYEEKHGKAQATAIQELGRRKRLPRP